MTKPLNIVILGLSITSSWGNGHATTFRALVRELANRGHRVLFLERDVPWYASNRDLPRPPYCETALYSDLQDLQTTHAARVEAADFVLIGSYVPDGIAVAEWALRSASGPVGFYDIDTPVTMAALAAGTCEYLSASHIEKFDIYMSFTGGPMLQSIMEQYGSPCARPLYCSVDPELYYPHHAVPVQWDLGYMGTYSDDRQPPLDALMLQAAVRWPVGRFTVVGPQYPDHLQWPANVDRIHHLPPAEHCQFYNAQRFTLNITRAEMVKAGYSPSVRLFEASACGVPVISDYWDGLDALFGIGRGILVSRSADETLEYIRELPEEERRAIGEHARQIVLQHHTNSRRAEQLESYILQMRRCHLDITNTQACT